MATRSTLRLSKLVMKPKATTEKERAERCAGPARGRCRSLEGRKGGSEGMQQKKTRSWGQVLSIPPDREETL